MRYNLYVNQSAAISLGVENITQAHILDVLVNASGWASPCIVCGEVYYWTARQRICEELTLLDLKPDTVYRHMRRLSELGLIDYSKNGKQDLTRPTEKTKLHYVGKKSELHGDTMSEKNPSKLGKKSEKHSEKNPTYPTTIHNPTIIDNTNIAPTTNDDQNGKQQHAEQQPTKQPATQPAPALVGELFPCEDSRKPKNAQNHAEGAKTKKASKGSASLVWSAYSASYAARHGIEPIGNARTFGMLANLVERLGEQNAISVAGWFPAHNNRWYVEKMHGVGVMLADCEKLYAEMMTGRMVTASSAMQADRTMGNYSALQEALRQIDAGDSVRSSAM
ncbi:MAG: hypothetical protein PHE17_05360 [Thiothrix sp.]|uniref:hypothetical protein n=1 Tax=Thiothrix sp. TaxID=1032 RepID=UPI00262D1844|nr:hypothetical protein [Thiothrix sp.]MDD5392430.1 hypothetical protein [Thiothrix sp.]